MHFTGTIWRPPYEASSLLLEVTSGCTHHRCKFCTLYEDLPFRFRMSPLEDIEADLAEAQMLVNSPLERLSAKLRDLPMPSYRRAFLTGGNPFVLKAVRLEKIKGLIGRYFPSVETVGCFARVTDIALKIDEELARLRALGYDGITIGVETGDPVVLAFMEKGYGPEDILEQCSRLEDAGISYHLFYLTGISGAGRGREGAKATAALFNRLHPLRIGSSMLTVYPESRLFSEMQAGRWREASEHEKLEEIEVLIEELKIPVLFEALGASNALQLSGRLPDEQERLLSTLRLARETWREEDMRRYREHLPHL